MHRNMIEAMDSLAHDEASIKIASRLFGQDTISTSRVIFLDNDALRSAS